MTFHWYSLSYWWYFTIYLHRKNTQKFDKSVEKIESKDRAVARYRYSKDIRDLFSRVYQPRDNVFRASGGSVTDTYKSETNKKKWIN